MPRLWGEGIIHSSHIDAMVYNDSDLYEREKHPLSEQEVKIGNLIAENLVDNGATLQMGNFCSKTLHKILKR